MMFHSHVIKHTYTISHKQTYTICALVIYMLVVMLYRYVTNVIAVQFSMSFCHTLFHLHDYPEILWTLLQQ